MPINNDFIGIFTFHVKQFNIIRCMKMYERTTIYNLLIHSDICRGI
ncbi:MAG: hypothetical protein RIS29_953 [Bacteroidota bacterium]|jgi:hypothetical protein